MRSTSGRRMLPRIIVLAAAVVTWAAVLPSQAFAANGGDPDQGTPPCDTQSVTRHNTITMRDPSNGATMGTAYLSYSAGCQTEWVTVHAYQPYYPGPSVWMQNQNGTNLYSAMDSGNPPGTYWTNQLTNMRYQAGCGGTQMYNGYTNRWVSWNYIGCY